MTTRKIAGMIGAGVVAVLWTTTALAQAAVYSGHIVGVTGGRLTIEEQSGQERVFSLARDVTVIRDGQAAKLDDLRNADNTTVAVDEKMIAVAIDAKSGTKSPWTMTVSGAAAPSVANEYEGSFVNADDGKITIVRKGSATQQSFAVAENAKITRNGQNVTLDELSNGDRVRIATETRLLVMEVAIVIEAASRT